MDCREALIKKARMDLPADFLKRWMVETNENITVRFPTPGKYFKGGIEGFFLP